MRLRAPLHTILLRKGEKTVTSSTQDYSRIAVVHSRCSWNGKRGAVCLNFYFIVGEYARVWNPRWKSSRQFFGSRAEFSASRMLFRRNHLAKPGFSLATKELALNEIPALVKRYPYLFTEEEVTLLMQRAYEDVERARHVYSNLADAWPAIAKAWRR